MTTYRVRDLLSHLETTNVDQAVADAKEFIEVFESTSGHDIPPRDRLGISQHLWSDHVNSSPCTSCRYAPLLSAWESRLPMVRLWPAWERLHERNPSKPPMWSAYKKLHIYLSLEQAGLKPGTRLSSKQQDGRLILCDGHNRVTLLAAMGRLDDELTVD